MSTTYRYSQSQAILRPLPLIIVAKTAMRNGFCYICYSHEFNCLIRPIYSIKQSFWHKNFDFQLGTSMLFLAHTIWHDLDLPHGHDDVLVSKSGLKRFGRQDTAQIFYLLANLSTTSMADIFRVNLASWRFVVEGTRCPSVGVLRLQRRNVNFFYNGDKRRLSFIDSSNVQTELPVTAVEDPFLGDCDPFEEVLIVVGLGRPFAGYDNEYCPRRCYFLALGCITQRYLSIFENIYSEQKSSLYQQLNSTFSFQNTSILGNYFQQNLTPFLQAPQNCYYQANFHIPTLHSMYLSNLTIANSLFAFSSTTNIQNFQGFHENHQLRKTEIKTQNVTKNKSMASSKPEISTFTLQKCAQKPKFSSETNSRNVSDAKLGCCDTSNVNLDMLTVQINGNFIQSESLMVSYNLSKPKRYDLPHSNISNKDISIAKIPTPSNTTMQRTKFVEVVDNSPAEFYIEELFTISASKVLEEKYQDEKLKVKGNCLSSHAEVNAPTHIINFPEGTSKEEIIVREAPERKSLGDNSLRELYREELSTISMPSVLEEKYNSEHEKLEEVLVNHQNDTKLQIKGEQSELDSYNKLKNPEKLENETNQTNMCAHRNRRQTRKSASDASTSNLKSSDKQILYNEKSKDLVTKANVLATKGGANITSVKNDTNQSNIQVKKKESERGQNKKPITNANDSKLQASDRQSCSNTNIRSPDKYKLPVFLQSLQNFVDHKEDSRIETEVYVNSNKATKNNKSKTAQRKKKVSLITQLDKLKDPSIDLSSDISRTLSFKGNVTAYGPPNLNPFQADP